jgi:hypothetical protein
VTATAASPGSSSRPGGCAFCASSGRSEQSRVADAAAPQARGPGPGLEATGPVAARDARGRRSQRGTHSSNVVRRRHSAYSDDRPASCHGGRGPVVRAGGHSFIAAPCDPARDSAKPVCRRAANARLARRPRTDDPFYSACTRTVTDVM